MPKVVLPCVAPNEIIPLQFDFASYLLLGETITSAVVTCSVYSGTDANPSAVTNGFSPAIVNTVVTNGAAPTIAGVIYQVSCAATTSNLDIHTLSGYLAVVPISL